MDVDTLKIENYSKCLEVTLQNRGVLTPIIPLKMHLLLGRLSLKGQGCGCARKVLIHGARGFEAP